MHIESKKQSIVGTGRIILSKIKTYKPCITPDCVSGDIVVGRGMLMEGVVISGLIVKNCSLEILYIPIF